MKTKQKTYRVTVVVKLDTELEIKAETFAEAVEKAKAYNVTDIVEFDTPHNDSSIEVTTVWNGKSIYE